MSRNIKLGLFAALLGAILMVGLWQIFGSKKIDMLNADAEVEISAQNLLSVLTNEDQVLEDNLKTEQIVEVMGLVKETNLMNGRITVLLKGKDEGPPYIICDMLPFQKSKVAQLKPNDSVKIKGMFKGYLKDAVFLDCVVTYSQTND